MIIARGLLVVVKVCLAIGCIVCCFMIFPIWYDICVYLKDFTLAIAPGLDSLMVMFLSFFPYLSIFLIGLGTYIGLVRLLDSATGEGKEVD